MITNSTCDSINPVDKWTRNLRIIDSQNMINYESDESPTGLIQSSHISTIRDEHENIQPTHISLYKAQNCCIDSDANTSINPSSDLNNNVNMNMKQKAANGTSHAETRKKYIIEYPFKLINYPIDRLSSFGCFCKLSFLFILNICLFLPLVFLLVTIILPFKLALRALFKLFHFCHLTDSSHLSPNLLPQFLNPTELFWLFNSNLNKQTNTLHGNKSIGACLFFIEGYLAKNTIRDLIQNRIIQANSRSSLGEFNRFSQRVLQVLGFGYVWVKTTEFNLDEHIIEIENTNNLKNDLELQKYISNLIRNQTFSLNKPLWTLYYIKSYGQSLNDKTTVLVFLYHQSFASGVGLIRLFLKGLVDNRNAIDLKPRFGYFNFTFSLLKQCLFAWSKIFYYLLLKLRDNNPLHFKYTKSDRYKNLNFKSNTQQPGEHILTWSEPFSLVLINRLKLVTRSKMNDLLISIVAGVLRNYLQLKGINNPADMHMLMPVDLSSNKFPFKLKNRSTLVSMRMPVNTEGCIPRLWTTKTLSTNLKQSNNYLFFYFLINLFFYFLPNRAAFSLIKHILNKSTYTASTLGAGDASLSTLSLCNRNVRSLIYFNPAICNLSLSFSIVTYGDEIRLGLQADSNVITNPELITTEFIKQLEILTDLLANRRIPGEIRRVVRPQIEISSSGASTNVLYASAEVAIEDMQQKMTDIQQELQVLSEHLDNLNTANTDYLKQKQIILIKSEKLRKEFRTILMKLQVRQNLNNQTIPSDDEDELDPNERIRLRSSSIVSKMSMGSNSTSKRNRESSSEHSNINMEKNESSRKASNCDRLDSRNGSLSFSSAASNEAISNVPNPSNNHLTLQNQINIENEYSISSRQQQQLTINNSSTFLSNTTETLLNSPISYQNKTPTSPQNNLIVQFYEEESTRAQFNSE